MIRLKHRRKIAMPKRRARSSLFIPMIDLKLARLAANPGHLDSMVDVAGYAAVLREVSP